jgi:very-short-patch-repair endonuclease
MSHLHDVHKIKGKTQRQEYFLKFFKNPLCACGCGKKVSLRNHRILFNLFADDCQNKGKFNNPTCSEFYLFRGYSVDETVENVRNIQSKEVRHEQKLLLIKQNKGDKNPASLKSIQERTGKSILDIKLLLSNKSAGKNNGFYGKKHNRETLRKLAIFRSMQARIVSRPELVVYGILSAMKIDFKYQAVVDIYTVDFLIDKLIIEVYGDFWHSEKFKAGLKKQKDEERICVLKTLGYNVLIFWESEIMKRTSQVVDKLSEVFKK